MGMMGYQIRPVWTRFVATASVVTAASCGTFPAGKLRQSWIKIQRTAGAENPTDEEAELKVADAELASNRWPRGVKSDSDQLPIFWRSAAG